MHFYTGQHQFYNGIDLHARSLYLCILNQQGETILHRNLSAEPEPLLKAIAPYREDIVLAVECVFCWYWMADLCAEEGIPFVLGHALYMKAIHGGKAKNDKIDSAKIAALLRGGMIPQAYVYPRKMRATRDLLRRRMHLMRKRADACHELEKRVGFFIREIGLIRGQSFSFLATHCAQLLATNWKRGLAFSFVARAFLFLLRIARNYLPRITRIERIGRGWDFGLWYADFR